MDHVPNEDDAEVWTAKTAIIRFNIVEMHHNDRVKMLFGMFQDIPRDPIYLDPWHLRRVDAQWGYDNWKLFPGSFVGCGKIVRTMSYNFLFTRMMKLCNTLLNTLLDIDP